MVTVKSTYLIGADVDQFCSDALWISMAGDQILPSWAILPLGEPGGPRRVVGVAVGTFRGTWLRG